MRKSGRETGSSVAATDETFFYSTLFSFFSSTLSSLSLPFFSTCVLLPTTTSTFADETTCTYTRTPGRTHARTLQGYCIYVANRRTAPLLRRLTQDARTKRRGGQQEENLFLKRGLANKSPSPSFALETF